MELLGKKLTQITPSQFTEVLESGKNILVFGPSGHGKTATVYEYAEEHGLKVIDYDLAGRLPEEVSGIPAVTGDYYRRTLDHELEEFFKVEGEGYILFFDEVNQGSPETLNTLYRITHPNPEMRKWAGHTISKCQVVACGNLTDGTDGTVYLTDLPTPLVKRFCPFELKPSIKDATEYLNKKYKDKIQRVGKYIKVILDAGYDPRTADEVLDMLHYNQGLLMESKIGTALTAKLLDLKNNISNIDPAKMLSNCRKAYKLFVEDGEIDWGGVTVTNVEVLKSHFKDLGLSDEEIAGIMKGDEE